MFEDSEPEQAPDEGTTLARSLAEAPRHKKQQAPPKEATRQAADDAPARRMLRPLDEQRGELDNVKVRRVGDVVQWRAKKGAEVRSMRIISAGVQWLEPCPGSGDIVKEDISDRAALQRAWGKPFDPLMYTVLCDMEYNPEVVYTLSFPGVPIMTGLNVYVHKTLRQMCGGTDGRGSSWNTVQFRDVGPLGPQRTHFKFSEFPKDAYAKPKARPADPKARQAGEEAEPDPDPDPEPEHEPEPAPRPPTAGLVKKGGSAVKPAPSKPPVAKKPATAGAIGAMFARAARAPGADQAIAFLEAACDASGPASHMARSLLVDMQAQRAAGAPEEERLKTLWGLHPASDTPSMSVAELESFINTDMRSKDRTKADAAMYALRVTRGIFGRLFHAVPADYCLPTGSGDKKRKAPPPDDFDM